MKTQFTIWILLFTTAVIFAQNGDDERKINFPDIPGYKTLLCDFHQHTVFSDGSVWPNIRVYEANKDGLDAISLTEHLEYQNHKEDIPHHDRNRSNEIAAEVAKDSELIVINGSEITRSLPPGHANAIFITDANKLLLDDPIDVFKEAKNQGAFTFWNHPNWIAQKENGIAELTEMHEMLIKEGLLHGIEIVNEHTYSEEALQIALDNNLTILGNTDVHGLIDWDFNIHHGGHRPITLVFAKEKSAEAIKDALFGGRTAVWFNNTLIGKIEFIQPLLKESILIKEVKSLNSYEGESLVTVVSLENNTDVEFILRNNSNFTLHRNADIVIIKPNRVTNIEVKTGVKMSKFNLNFEVLNVVTAPNEHPEVFFDILIK